ncbi:TetR/AcrR family transcriptional regulator [Verrucomicrobiota bacterium sgz303538]
MSATTKERILDAAEEIMLTKSFHSVGLNEILTAVKVPKGSFYHYFASKEQFGVELLRHYCQEHAARLRKIFSNKDLNPLERLAAYFNGTVTRMMESECCNFCLVSKLGAEVSTFSEPMRQVLADGMADWRSLYEKLVREGQEQGVIRKDLDPAATASVIQDIWHGAMNRLQIERSVAPLRTAADFLRSYLSPA